jgi:hypothetical protein
LAPFKSYVGSPDYTLIHEHLKTQATHLTIQLPYLVTINRDHLETIYSAREIAGVMGLVTLFQIFLPGLIIDVDYLRKLLLSNER